jgi:hypothetical protein
VSRAAAESALTDDHGPAATVGHLPKTADTVQPEVAATEDHLAIQLDAHDVCPPLGENLLASDGLCRRPLIALPAHEGREERPGSRPLEWCMGCLLSCDWFVWLARVGVN